jgi:hypothetical protein
MPGSLMQNGSSNGAVPRYSDLMPLPDEPLPIAPVAMSPGAMSSPGMPAAGLMSSAPGGVEAGGFAGSSSEMLHAPVASGDTTRKILAALATGILIGFIIARLFF